MDDNRRSMRRRTLSVAGGLSAAMLFASTAWACTPGDPNAATVVNPTSVDDSTDPEVRSWTLSGAVTASTSGYFFRFINSSSIAAGNECHKSTRKFGAAETSNSSGTIPFSPAKYRTIDLDNIGGADLGVGHVCWALDDADTDGDAAFPDELAVT